MESQLGIGWHLFDWGDAVSFTSHIADHVRSVDDERNGVQNDHGADPKTIGFVAWVEVESGDEKDDERCPQDMPQAENAGESESAGKRDKEYKSNEERHEYHVCLEMIEVDQRHDHVDDHENAEPHFHPEGRSQYAGQKSYQRVDRLLDTAPSNAVSSPDSVSRWARTP